MIKDELKREYVAVKPKGFNRFIWFLTEKVSDDGLTFKGKDGWGKGGAFTHLECDSNQIVATIYSDDPQYT